MLYNISDVFSMPKENLTINQNYSVYKNIPLTSTLCFPSCAKEITASGDVQTQGVR